jgi:ankyrin repeat protein
MAEPDEDLLGQGEEEVVVVKEKAVKERPKNRLNLPYWWRKYQLPAEIKDHRAYVPVQTSGKWPIRVLLDDGIRAGDITATQKAVNAGADVKHINLEGHAPVHEAVLHDQASIVQTLWDNGADVDVGVPYSRDTALHLAARQNAAASIRSLVRVEASTDLVNKDGDTALHVAAKLGFYEATCELLAGGADPSVKNKDGRTAKELAELNDFPELAAYLLNFD